MSLLNHKKLSAFSFFMIIPFAALANAGSPMLWFSIFHLFVLNLIIGIVESQILNRMGIKNRVGLVIIANYISMFVGIVLLSATVAYSFTHKNFWDSYDLKSFSIGMVIAFFITLLIEYPFFCWSLKNKRQKKELFPAFIKANLVTYLIMSLIYLLFIVLF